VGCFENGQRNEFENLNFVICTERFESGRYLVTIGRGEGVGGVDCLVGTAALVSPTKYSGCN
jgi:hypothetical protein